MDCYSKTSSISITISSAGGIVSSSNSSSTSSNSSSNSSTKPIFITFQNNKNISHGRNFNGNETIKQTNKDKITTY